MLPDGGVLAADDVGDLASDDVVVYLHGAPDCRLARHPDDGLVAAAGVRLLALDRPGYGGTSASPKPWTPDWPAAVADDAAAVLDDMSVSGEAFVIAVVIFTLVEVLVAPGEVVQADQELVRIEATA